MRRTLTAAASAVLLAGLGTAAPARAAADLPNTFAAAKAGAFSTVNTYYQSTIDSPTDVDWFKFDVPATTRSTALLGSRPGDYNISVHDATGKEIARSFYTGTHFERPVVSVTPGTYYTRVSTKGYYAKSKPYTLRFRQLPVGVVALD